MDIEQVGNVLLNYRCAKNSVRAVLAYYLDALVCDVYDFIYNQPDASAFFGVHNHMDWVTLGCTLQTQNVGDMYKRHNLPAILNDIPPRGALNLVRRELSRRDTRASGIAISLTPALKSSQVLCCSDAPLDRTAFSPTTACS